MKNLQATQGFVLITALIGLLVIGLLGLSSLQFANLEQKISSRFINKNDAAVAAETAFNAAQQEIMNQTTLDPSFFDCSSMPCLSAADQTLDLTQQSSNWWTTHSNASTATLLNIKTAPRVIIMMLDFVPDNANLGDDEYLNSGTYFFQITVRATGNTDDAVAYVQGVVARRY